MRSEKKQLVGEIGQVLTDSAFVYFVSYKGLPVKHFTVLRDELAKHDARCIVLKNRLILKAAQLNDLSDLAGIDLADDTALISGTGDAGAVAKVIKDFNKSHNQVAAKAGMIEGGVLTAADVDAIAALPSKEALQAQLLGVLQAPARNLVSVLNNSVASIVNVLNNYKEKLEDN
ncbi:MAG: 50S ribosomal protein L10 [Victivallales bacterium]|nr:50S ribosomal protein L10 [Victivallales bacterium]